MNDMKEDPTNMDKLLYPGKKLSDFDLKGLKVEVIPSGFASFDEKMIFKKNYGELILLCARPGLGKSSLGFQIATNIAVKDKVHVFSIEMSHRAIAARQMAIKMNRPLSYIQNGGADNPEGELAQKELDKLNFHVDERSGLTVYHICEAARMQNKKSKTSLIVVDYAQIVSTDTKEARHLALANVAYELKTLARELRIPVLLLSQLNRNSEFREGGRPQLSDIKESGALEEASDVVLLIHREHNSPNLSTIIVAKNKEGATGDIPMQFAPAQCRFIDSKGGDLD